MTTTTTTPNPNGCPFDEDFVTAFVEDCFAEADRRGLLGDLPAAPPLDIGVVFGGAAYDDRSPVGDE